MREFDLGDILSITTGRFVSGRRLKDVLGLVAYVTGTSLPVDRYPTVDGECAASLLEQHPKLSSVDASALTAENVESWLSEQKAIYGDKLSV